MKQLPLTIFAAVLLAAGTAGHGAGPLEQLAQAEGGDSARPEGGVALANGGLRLNEILASNRAGRLDDEGQTSDWIEIHNPGASRGGRARGRGVRPDRFTLLRVSRTRGSPARALFRRLLESPRPQHGGKTGEELKAVGK